MEKKDIFRKIKNRLIVSCQALPGEPLHGSDYMAKMAIAAEMGGAAAIRANGVHDIEAIRQSTTLPIIGLIKRDYEDSDVYITPTKLEIDELINAGVDMIALDATKRTRPNNETLATLIEYMKKRDQLVFADISTVEEGIEAFELGADCVSTTMSGYTNYTADKNKGPNVELIRELSKRTNQPVIAEGRVKHPQEAVELLEAGAFSVVVGGAITRPQQITQTFAEAIEQGGTHQG